MKTFIFDGELDNDNVKGLITEMDKVPSEENIVIYFTSPGGSGFYANILVDYINRNSERFEIYCLWQVSSFAFDIILRVKCKVVISEEAFATVHLFSNTLEVRELENPLSVSTYLKKDADTINKKLLERMRLGGFTKDELKLLKNGGDILCDSIRMKHIMSILKGENE